MTRFFPARLATYMARSARLMTSSPDSLAASSATPALKVIRTPLVAGEEEVPGELSLQAFHGCDALVQVGIRHQDHEFLAAVARQGVDRSHVVANDLHQVNQGFVTAGVAQAVIELLEIVDVEQGQRQHFVLASDAGDLARQSLVESTAVEDVGQGSWRAEALACWSSSCSLTSSALVARAPACNSWS
jgi:hypothetical protein